MNKETITDICSTGKNNVTVALDVPWGARRMAIDPERTRSLVQDITDFMFNRVDKLAEIITREQGIV